MHFNVPRIAVAAIVALGLAACSGQSTVPTAGQPASAPDLSMVQPYAMPASFGDATSPNAKSPCDVGIWYFRGSCVAAPIASKANTVALKAYKTYALTIGFPKSNAANTVFLLGVGTSSKDITGKFNGAKFPDYGSIPCATPKGKVVTCTGKAFLYLFVANSSTTLAVKFPSIPSGTITTTGAFPGTKSCSAIVVHTNGSTGQPDAWILLPGSVKPVGDKVSVPSVKSADSFGPHTFAVLGFTCQ